MKRYYMIGELSKIYNIGRDAIKYYEELEILKPKRDENGYRVYSIDDVCKLNLIRELRNLNVPMKEIKSYLYKRNVESTKEMLNIEIDIVTKKIEELEKQRLSIKDRLDGIKKSEKEEEFNVIKVEHYTKRKGIIVDGNMNSNEDTDFLIQKLRKKHEEDFYIIGNNGIGSVFDLESVQKGIFNKYKNVIAFSNQEDSTYDTVLKEGLYLILKYKGGYAKNKIYLPKMFEYAKENNYKIIGNPVEIYNLDIHETSEEEEFKTTLQVRVEKLKL